MKKTLLLLTLASLVLSTWSEAQVIMRRRPYMRNRVNERERPALPRFKPQVSVSIGYGFPNLDKLDLPEYYNAYRGSVSQTGPVTAAIDYRFMRAESIGLMVTHGSVTAPYYDYNSNSGPAFKAKLDNWSIMLNLVRYFPAGEKVTPYLHTAIGVNIWDQQYMDPQGNKIAMTPVDLPDFSYQVGLGARFNFSKHAGLFIEAGYGKYIVHGGLSMTL